MDHTTFKEIVALIRENERYKTKLVKLNRYLEKEKALSAEISEGMMTVVFVRDIEEILNE